MPGDNILGDCTTRCCNYLPPRLLVYKKSVTADHGGFSGPGVYVDSDPIDYSKWRRITPSGDLTWPEGTGCVDGYTSLSGSAAKTEFLPGRFSNSCIEKMIEVWNDGEGGSEDQEQEICPDDDTIWNVAHPSCVAELDREQVGEDVLRVTYDAAGDDDHVVDYTFSELYTEEEWLDDVRTMLPDPPIDPVVVLTRTGEVVTGAAIVEAGSFEAIPAAGISAPGGGTGLFLTLRYRVKEVRIVHPGSPGFSSPPTITIGAPGGGGTTATAEAVLDGDGRVQSVNVTNHGSGYSTVPVVSNLGPTLVAVMELASVVIVAGGSGYLLDPVLKFAISTTLSTAFNRRLGGFRISQLVLDVSDFGPDVDATMEVGHYRWAVPWNRGDTNRLRWLERKISVDGEPVTGLEIAWPGCGLAMLRQSDSASSVLGVRFAGGSIAEVVIIDPGFHAATSGPIPVKLPIPRPDSGGTQATATGKLRLRQISLGATGSGYTSAPTVQFSGGGGSGAEAVAHVVDGKVVSFTIVNRGVNYTAAPTVTLVGGGGSGATAGAVVGWYEITLTHAGTGYDHALTVSPFADGTGAEATITVDEDPTSETFGQVIGVALTNGGADYTSAPQFSVSGPGQEPGGGWPVSTPDLPVIYARMGEEFEKTFDWDGELPADYSTSVFQSWPMTPWYTIEPPEDGYVIEVGNYREDFVE